MRLRHYATSWKVVGSRPDEMNKFFFNLPNPSGRNMPWGIRNFLQMSTGSRKLMFLGSKERPVRKADNLTVICEPTV
jgi:hypothetical protein